MDLSTNQNRFSPETSERSQSPLLCSDDTMDDVPSMTPCDLGDLGSGGEGVRQNQVGSTTLAGVPIVSLFIDGKERLCLAQISNTLLKTFSYNEIHNRRVALGITCVQCTPVQLEILRRAGAMPISSRRCGMITRREAERLVKSFLEETTPPKLPDNFAFRVEHTCGWGCKGSFIPSRYNSSRAKCIKCSFCNMFFSPNKFIFHFHRMPDGKYHHPDAANFNSWRRHLRLDYEQCGEELTFAWEDVKAMFNGGSRKRIITPLSKTSRQDSEVKRPTLDSGETSNKMSAPLSFTYPFSPSPAHRAYNMFAPRSPHPAFPFLSPSPDSLAFTPSALDTRKLTPNTMWQSGKNSPYCNPFNLFWAKNMYPELNQPLPNITLPINPCETRDYDLEEAKTSEPLDRPSSSDYRKYMSAFTPVSKHSKEDKSDLDLKFKAETSLRCSGSMFPEMASSKVERFSPSPKDLSLPIKVSPANEEHTEPSSEDRSDEQKETKPNEVKESEGSDVKRLLEEELVNIKCSLHNWKDSEGDEKVNSLKEKLDDVQAALRQFTSTIASLKSTSHNESDARPKTCEK